jgi:anthranilate/para-aminobenzoate synthase component I
MQIISELEGTTRGPYGGCVGYFSFNGNLDTCITIRTALLKDGKAYVQAGGGWVNDSEPEAEFQETVNKSKAMLIISPHPSPVTSCHPLPRADAYARFCDFCMYFVFTMRT